VPERGPGSGTDVRERLEAGEEVTWRFTPGERRLKVTLSDALGGGSHEVEIEGGYTLALRRAPAAASA
jgi:hypothetical protein